MRSPKCLDNVLRIKTAICKNISIRDNLHKLVDKNPKQYHLFAQAWSKVERLTENLISLTGGGSDACK